MGSETNRSNAITNCPCVGTILRKISINRSEARCDGSEGIRISCRSVRICETVIPEVVEVGSAAIDSTFVVLNWVHRP